MNGATVNVVGLVKKVKANEKEISVDVLLNDLDISDLHGLIFLSGDGVESYWNNEKIHQIVKSANQDKKILGVIGAAAPILVYSDEKLLEKKMTCDKENAKTMMDKKANYTGNEIESDENIVSTTGFNKETIDGFLAKIKSPIKDFSLKQTKD
jgi:putative intracellular protease/amidase